MRFLYSLLLYLLSPLVWGYFLLRGLREPAYLSGWPARLGLGYQLPEQGFWVHGASVGEVQAALSLVRALRERYPETPCFMTAFTPTGLAQAKRGLGDDVPVVYLPLDWPGAVKRFLRHSRPRAGIIVETELWPNLLHHCERDDIRVLLANARLSERSLARYSRWPLQGLMQKTVAGITQIAAASEADAERLRRLGAPAERIVHTGNLKFELALPPDTAAEGQRLRSRWRAEARPVWVAASTHQGEEVTVLDALTELRRTHPNILLVLVPRHPQRFDAVARLCLDRGFNLSRFSRSEPVDTETHIVLGDTLGDLPQLYATADLAFVGGSLVEGVGGHNLLEPAALRLPIVTGTQVAGWQQIADWLEEAGALCRVTGTQALVRAVAECLDDSTGRMQAGLAAAQVVETHGGALERTLRLVPQLLTPSVKG